MNRILSDIKTIRSMILFIWIQAANIAKKKPKNTLSSKYKLPQVNLPMSTNRSIAFWEMWVEPTYDFVCG